jgi:hypothetical protein
MDELMMQWEELVESGETTESFDDWYSGRVADACDDAKDAQQDRDMGL